MLYTGHPRSIALLQSGLWQMAYASLAGKSGEVTYERHGADGADNLIVKIRDTNTSNCHQFGTHVLKSFASPKPSDFGSS